MPYDKRDLRGRFTLTPELRAAVAKAAGLRAPSFFQAIFPYGATHSTGRYQWDRLLQTYDLSGTDDRAREMILRTLGHRAASVVQTIARQAPPADPPGIDTSDGNILRFSGDWPGTTVTVEVTVTDVDGDSGTRTVDATVPTSGATAAQAAALVRDVIEPLAHVRARRRGSVVTVLSVDERSAVHVAAQWREN